LFIDDEGRMTVDTMRARARRMFRQHGIKLFVVDYIQLMRSSTRRKREDRVQELAEISAEFVALGKELNVPFILLAQMNRDFEKEATRAPRLSDLKDCGSIEQDADLVGFLHTPKMNDTEKERYTSAMAAAYPADEWSKRPVRVNLLWAKNRYGPTGRCELLFQKSSTLFHDYNVWLKRHAYKTLAAGDSRSYEPPASEQQEEFDQ
jgi:replicative DNA helicase